MELVGHSYLHTERVGERLARLARPGDVVALWGELGAGKTVLAKGITTGLGLNASDVSSPTFVILHEHFGGRLPLFHLDLYRLEGKDLATTGWEETLDASRMTVVEWPDRAGKGSRSIASTSSSRTSPTRSVRRAKGDRASLGRALEGFRDSLRA